MDVAASMVAPSRELVNWVVLVSDGVFSGLLYGWCVFLGSASVLEGFGLVLVVLTYSLWLVALLSSELCVGVVLVFYGEGDILRGLWVGFYFMLGGCSFLVLGKADGDGCEGWYRLGYWFGLVGVVINVEYVDFVVSVELVVFWFMVGGGEIGDMLRGFVVWFWLVWGLKGGFCAFRWVSGCYRWLVLVVWWFGKPSGKLGSTSAFNRCVGYRCRFSVASVVSLCGSVGLLGFASNGCRFGTVFDKGFISGLVRLVFFGLDVPISVVESEGV
ncbi:hypothetical protein Tco_0144844 [Tanacetum coccineum]